MRGGRSAKGTKGICKLSLQTVPLDGNVRQVGFHLNVVSSILQRAEICFISSGKPLSPVCALIFPWFPVLITYQLAKLENDTEVMFDHSMVLFVVHGDMECK